MCAKAKSQNQRALCALISLVTASSSRSGKFVTNGNAPRFAWATPFGLHPASVLARLAAGEGVAGFALRPSPLPVGFVASISVKGKGSARHPHPFGARPAGCAPHAASGVALDADSSQDTATAPTWTRTTNPALWPGQFGDGRTPARLSQCHQSTNRQSSPLATTLCNLVACCVTNAR
jgi:hypothetical protein